MRISILFSLIVLAGCMPATRGQQQSSISIGIQLGPERSVNSYSAERHGDWRTNYEKWQPTTLWVVDGRYYDKESRGARAVVVYRRDNEYFTPPQDKEWVGSDKRYDYNKRP
jgi:hypothetical protein